MKIQLLVWDDDESRRVRVEANENLLGFVFNDGTAHEIIVTPSTPQDGGEGGVTLRVTHGQVTIHPNASNSIVARAKVQP